MKRYFIILLFGIFATLFVSCENTITPEESSLNNTTTLQETIKETTQKKEPSYYGTWAVKDYQMAEISALSTEEVETFMSYTVTYQEDAVLQNGQNMNVSDFGYEFTSYTEETLVQDYHANLGEWWNDKKEVSSVIVTSLENFFGSQFFIADEETLWIYYEGVFFLARKAES